MTLVNFCNANVRKIILCGNTANLMIIINSCKVLSFNALQKGYKKYVKYFEKKHKNIWSVRKKSVTLQVF